MGVEDPVNNHLESTSRCRVHNENNKGEHWGASERDRLQQTERPCFVSCGGSHLTVQVAILASNLSPIGPGEWQNCHGASVIRIREDSESTAYLR